MSNKLWLMIGGVVLVFLLAAAGALFARRRRPRRLKQDYFQTKWQELQKMLKDKDAWTTALQNADTLLDEALKRKRFRGRSMGERLVRAQRILSDNDGVWFGHKLSSKVRHEPDTKIKETEVKDALVGIRQALKDLGALPDTLSKATDKGDKK